MTNYFNDQKKNKGKNVMSLEIAALNLKRHDLQMKMLVLFFKSNQF